MASPTQAIVSVASVLILDTDTGDRVLAKYYGPAAPDAQRRRFESLVAARARAAPSGEVVLVDNMVVVYRVCVDVLVCVCGRAPDASELLLATALDCLVDALGVLVRVQAGSPMLSATSSPAIPSAGPSAVLERATLMDAYDVACLAIDEVVNRGIVLEINAGEVVARAQKHPAGSVSSTVSTGAGPDPEPSLSSAFSFAKKSLRSFLSK